MKKNIIASLLAATAVTAAVIPAMADAQPRHRYLVCRSQRHVRHAGNTGTVVGAVGGGLLGHAIGGDTTGTVVGAGVGAVAGHQLAKRSAKRDCHYVYR